MGPKGPATACLRRSSWANAPAALLGLILLWVMASAARDLALGYPYGVDLEIPLRAAERWLAGGNPYPAAAFDAPNGPGLPYLYPPFVLPLTAPLTVLPRAIPMLAWTAILAGTGYLTARRLGFRPVVAVVALFWPPFLEGIVGGNVQVLLFAAFVALLYRDGRQEDPANSTRPAAIDGFLGTFIGALKVSQVHAWAFLLRRRPTAAMIGLAIFGALAIATLPLVGADRWLDWLSQAGRSGDPTWPPVGAPLSIFVGQPLALAISLLSVLAVFLVPARQAAAWIGILTLLGAPSLHMFGLLFLLPAMLVIRRELALIAAILVATYVSQAIWVAILGVAWTLLASSRWPRLRASVGNPIDQGPPTSD